MSSDRLLLELAWRLFGITSTSQVLELTCREALTMTGAMVAVASLHDARDRSSGVQVICDPQPRDVSAAARSALFALHHRLARQGGVLELASGNPDDAAVLAALAPQAPALVAVSILNRHGNKVGSLAVATRTTASASVAALLERLAATASPAIEAAQRLGIAKRDQERMLLLAEATDEALWDWNLETSECWWGGGINKLLGEHLVLVRGKQRGFTRIHRDDESEVVASLDEALRSVGSSWRAEYRVRRSDGSYVRVEDRGYFLRDASGRAYRVVGAVQDISPLREALERERAARDEAEHASRAKDEFLAMLGHELRNPLAPILTATQLMRTRDVSRFERELAVVERQAGHLIRLVDDLLDVSRIVRGKIELKRERVELETAVLKALEMVRPLVDERRQAIHIDVPRVGLAVHVDTARIAQVISNALTNASKFTERGGQIDLVATRNGPWAELRVRDNGIGIAADMLPHVFDMFAQEGQGLERGHGGLGLGLSIAKNLVTQHDGEIAIHSAGRGHGTELVIRLPAAAPVAPASTAADLAVSVATVAARRILVVDDNEDAAALLAELLGLMGHTTHVVHDGAEALAAARDFDAQVAILDIGLPVMDGYELARKLRELHATRALRLIALTGYGRDVDRQRAEQARFDAHLVKPVDIRALQRLLQGLAAET